MKKTYIIDTNVLLDDPKAFLAFKKNNVVIPYKVIEELEKHKRTPGEVGMNARDCSRNIAKLLSKETKNTLSSGVALESGGKLFVSPTSDFENTHNLSLESGDDHILHVCIGISETWKSAHAVLVSNDIILRVRANSFGLKCETYNSDSKIHNIDDLYSGYKVVKAKDDLIAMYHEEYPGVTFGMSSKELVPKDKLYPNDFIMLNHHDSAKKKPYPLLRVKENGRKKELHFVKEKKLGSKLTPKNAEQAMALELLLDPKVNLVTLTGISGCGKTLMALAAGLEHVLEKKNYKQLIVMRPFHAVGKDIGFLPGTKEEKMEPWLAPIKDNLRFLYGKESVDWMFERGTIEAEAMTFIRGRSLPNAYIIIDEAQNINTHELKALLTRVGKGTKIILTGDIEQTDRIDVDSISNGLSVAIEKFKEYSISGHVTMTEGIRSELSELAAKLL